MRRQMLGLAWAVAAGCGVAWSPALAETAAETTAETAVVGASQVSVLPMPFLTADELAALRVVLTSEQALQLFVPAQDGSAGGFAALAVNPEDGFIRDGAVVKSAVALAGLPDAATAAIEAVKACEAARIGPSPCVVVLTVEPAP